MANIKELSKKEERFTGGHRACSGCGASIIMRQTMIAVADKNVIVGESTGCMEVVSTLFPYTAWKVPFIHSAFENSAATISGVEAAYQSLKKQGKLTKDIKFIAFGGDGGTYDIGFQSLSGAMERGHDMVYICYDNQAYMNCLSLDSLIATKEGIKKITEIKFGDEVYAFDMKTHQLVLKKCSGVYDNGIHDVYELSTFHHSIKATSNHPFLVLKRNGTGKGKEFVWKELKDVSPGDEIVVSKQLTPGKSMQFNFQGSKKGDYKAHKINEVDMQVSSSEYKNILVADTYFSFEKVKNTKLIGEEPTLDLQVEDAHNFIANGMVVHNTGVQRSSATPKGASTTTAPAGKVKQGKEQFRKDLTATMVAHNIPYVAQSAIGFWNDYVTKVQKAVETKGPAFINVLAPCRLGWPHDPAKTPDIGRIAVNTCYWPVYEVVNGKYKINQKPKQKLPITEWLKTQGRFKHLFRPENKQLIDEIQQEVDSRWEHLLKLEQAFGN